MTALNPAHARAFKAKQKTRKTRRGLTDNLRQSISAVGQDNMRSTMGFVEEGSPNKANQELLYKDKMPQKEMTRSHYLMSKITGRMDKEGHPLASRQFHGSAYKYLTEESPEKEDQPTDLQLIQEGEQSEGESFEREAEEEDEQQELGELVKEIAPQPWTKIDQVITLLQNQPDDTGQFFYLSPGSESDPYDLKPNIEAADEFDRKKFYTLSKKGITTYIGEDPVEYISLNDWIHDREHYRIIRKKPFFEMFRRWKIIRMWRRNIMAMNRNQAMENLKANLFILDDDLGLVLREHKRICTEMESQRFVNMAPSHDVQTRDEFAATQSKQRNKVEEFIGKASRDSRERFQNGIDSILDKLKESIHKETQEATEFKTHEEVKVAGKSETITTEQGQVLEKIGFKPDLKYGAKSELRKKCSRFLRFSYLLDFIALEALSNIYLNSVRDLIKRLA